MRNQSSGDGMTFGRADGLGRLRTAAALVSQLRIAYLGAVQHQGSRMARVLITSALPYINGIKHLGNLVGSQLPADVYARYMRARGHEVLFICATDEHGTPAELAAARAGEPVADYCARMWRVQEGLADGFQAQLRPFRPLVQSGEPGADPAFRRAALTTRA